MEETEVDLRVPHDPISQMEALEHYRKTGKREKKTINTRNILFIVSGAFNGLEDIVKKRMKQKGIGFGATISSKDTRDEYLRYATAEDLISYGFESEFIGRLPVITVFHQLEVEDLYHILKNPHSPIIASKKQDFRAYGIDLRLEDNALWKLAEMAQQERTGARGLISAIEKVLLKFERRLPSTAIRELVVTEKMAHAPHEELESILQNPTDEHRKARYHAVVAEERTEMKSHIESRSSEFQDRYSLLLTDARLECIVDRTIVAEIDVNSAFEEALSIYYRIKGFEKTFMERYDIELTFESDAIDLLLREILCDEKEWRDLLGTLENFFGPALKLIRDRTGTRAFSIPRDGIVDPEAYLDQLIKQAYDDESSEAGEPRA